MCKIEYKKNICAFIDILGYKNMVANVEKGIISATETIMNLENIIKECIQKHINSFNSRGDSIDYIIFSDCIIITTPIVYPIIDNKKNTYSKEYTDDYISENYVRAWTFMLLLMDIQMLALEYGIIFRGAVTIGNHYKSEHIMFSNALIKAYNAESNKAVYPRIIIDQNNDNDILDLYSFTNGMLSDGLIIKDGDTIFIDYIGRINSMRNFDPTFTSRYLLMHKEFIEKNIEINRNNNIVLKKYIWMALYHNYREIYNEDKYKIKLAHFHNIECDFNSCIIIPK